ncbi:MAG: hypothetical protein MRY63_01615 [Neomegalonema sp.]|nr:hypothetical protein [Neomegalonema sp.]
MNSISDIILRPSLPEWILWALAALALCLIGVAFWRGLKGAWLRLAALVVLMAALLDPAFVREQRETRPDIALVLIDRSASQSIDGRDAQTDRVEAALAEQLDQLQREAGDAPLEVRRVEIGDSGAEGTRLVSAMGQAIADIPQDQLAGVIVVSDGAIADADLTLEAFDAENAPPVHLLLTGREDEFDRRLIIEKAPGFGLVGGSVPVRFRIEQSGTVSAALPSSLIEIQIDGETLGRWEIGVGQPLELDVPIEHAGGNVVEIRAQALNGELTDRNNSAAVTINGIRDRLRVLLISGEPYAGERVWRNLLKSDASVDLVHFTILRPPGKSLPIDMTREMSLIPFPTRELFDEKIEEFDLIIFDRYRNVAGLLDRLYIENISNYVFGGGAVLVSTGPAFATVESLYNSPLAEILPARPSGDIIEQAYRPKLTELGLRHPITRVLEGRNSALEEEAAWGRWFRHVDIKLLGGDVIMSGSGNRPLLVLDRVGEGRVAMIASDHPWLWARGYDGGGPQKELLRRTAHWLMREPELEEEALTTAPAPDGFLIVRRSLVEGPKTIESTAPDGSVQSVTLELSEPGVWRGRVQTDMLGIHRLTDASDSMIAEQTLTAVAVVGPPNPAEFVNPISTGEYLGPLVAASGGGLLRVGETEPAVRRVALNRSASGRSWIGLQRRGAYSVTGVSLGGVAPAWLFFALAAALAVLAWRVEGR